MPAIRDNGRAEDGLWIFNEKINGLIIERGRKGERQMLAEVCRWTQRIARRDDGIFGRLFVYQTSMRGIEFSKARKLERGIFLPVYFVILGIPEYALASCVQERREGRTIILYNNRVRSEGARRARERTSARESAKVEYLCGYLRRSQRALLLLSTLLHHGT